MSDFLEAIMCERARQDDRWGVEDHSDSFWFIILSEEIGEVARNLCDAPNVENPSEVRTELVHVVAVALAWLEAIERR